MRFVLDRVEQLAAGCHPDVDRRELPVGRFGALGPRRIGAFGWSKAGRPPPAPYSLTSASGPG
ncbi:hypothetical protein [Streptomyces sp. NPDC088707]|uniref:hypothetical protein n=1 Tax=Streptomyces sp. NPDC088707 TaxID=3365871 RepID=UPI00381B41CC